MTAQYTTQPGPLGDLQEVADNLHIVQADVTGERAIMDLFVDAAEFFEQEVEVLVGGFLHATLLADIL